MGFRILMVLDHYPPILGGAQLQTQLLSKQLVQRGHKVSVATTWQVGLPEYEAEGSVDIYRIKGLTMRIPWFFKDPGWRRHPPPFPEPGLVWGLRRLIERFQPDVVQTYGWISYSCAAALLGKSIPMIVSCRDYGHSCATRLLMHESRICDGPMIVKCVRCASAYFGAPKAAVAVGGLYIWRNLLIHKTAAFHSVSRFVHKAIRRDLRGMPSNGKQHGSSSDLVIHDVFDDSKSGRPDPAYLNQLPPEPYILFVGTLAQHKGIHVLLAAYRKLVSPPPLVMIGITAPDTPASFPDGVTVLRNVPHPTVLSAWERCLFGVIPSMCPDSLPNTVLEGMSYGKAIIGSNAGGIPDMIVDGETGLLFPLGDVDALAQAMERLHTDRDLRDLFGRAAKVRVNQFSPETVLPQFEWLYQQLVVNHG